MHRPKACWLSWKTKNYGPTPFSPSGFWRIVGLSKKGQPHYKLKLARFVWGMNNRKVTFKEYTIAQASLLPAGLKELIPVDHLVRIVKKTKNQIDIKPQLTKYKGSGASSYRPRMRPQVLV